MKKLLSVLALVAVFGFIMGCEGPAGVNGKDGVNGIDGSTKCEKCHGNNDDVNLKFHQYDLSTHNKGIIYEEEAGRVQCGGCHSGDGFAEAVAAGVDDPTTNATAKISCVTCHKIHTKYDSTDFALRFTGSFKMRINAFQYEFKGAGALCAKCHQGRAYTLKNQATDTLKGTGYNRLGPHYGVIGNVFAMNGPYQVTGSTSYPTTNPHAQLTDACVSCHLAKNNTNPAIGGHTFRIPLVVASNKLNASNFKDVAECKTACHSDPTFFTNPLTKANEVKAMLAEARTILITKGWLDTTQAVGADGTYNILGEYVAATPAGKIYTIDQEKLILNYMYIAKEKSFGIHNPTYVYAIMKNTLEALKQ